MNCSFIYVGIIISAAQGCGVYICQYMDIFQRLWFLSWIPWQRVSCWQGSYWTKGVNIPHFPYWWLPIRFLIRVAPRVSLVEQELTHFPVFCEVFVAQYLGFLCSILKIIVRAFFFSFLVTVLSDLLRFTASDYLFDIFYLFSNL